jgi:hypothetical protein
MTLEQKPFVNYKLDEEKELDEGETFTIRLNKKERKILNTWKRHFDIKSDGKTLKILALTIAPNVLHRQLGEKLLRYLFKKDRARLSDYENFEP